MISDNLKGVISQMLRPLKGLPLDVVIEGLSGYKVIPFDKHDKKDIRVLGDLENVARKVLSSVNNGGILSKRSNEVGNYIEPFVIDALNSMQDYDAGIPVTLSGKRKSSGYPDIQFCDPFDRVNYLECKTYNKENINTTQRSFYISPSDDFKVSKDAHHFGISFEIYMAGRKGDENVYKVSSWKILDLSKLELDVKYEFNSNNKRLYSEGIILSEGGL